MPHVVAPFTVVDIAVRIAVGAYRSKNKWESKTTDPLPIQVPND